MNKIRLDIMGMTYSQSQSNAYALLLGERNGKRRLPIIIGGFEAQAIAIELEKIKTPRPLTHDLFKSFAETFDITLTEVVINKFHEGVFYAQLVCSSGEKVVEVDSRTSDAIALALRFNCPIYTYESILAEAAMSPDEEQEATADSGYQDEPPGPEIEDYRSYTLPELKDMLKQAVENEEYEKASRIRDEINQRKTK